MGTINWSETQRTDVVDVIAQDRDSITTSITIGCDLEHTQELMLRSAIRIIIDNEQYCEFSLWRDIRREVIENDEPIICRPTEIVRVGNDELYVVAGKYDPKTGNEHQCGDDYLFIPLSRIANVYVP